MRAEALEDIRVRMDRMYAPQKLIYDATRKYYLLGRDRLIAELDAKSGQSVLEVGCGTGRNLVAIGRRYPDVRLLGLDAAAPMLDAAREAAGKAGLQITLARGIAEELDPGAMFGAPDGLDHVVISYCLSMVDDPLGALDRSIAALKPGGTLHVADFGDMAGLPGWFGGIMRAWLDKFGVHHRPEVEAHLRAVAATGAGRLEVVPIARRYALLCRFRKAP
ncbi:MAG: class I SAM-dependent methyltransferase [Geminicoccaceae bacterium]